jgi:2-enoate reductase
VKLGVRVKNTEELHADEIIVATGAKPIRLPIKGCEYAMDATEYLLGEKPVGERVVIVGGGLTGCEIAYDLYLQGKQPTIVEMKDDLIAVRGVCLANSSFLRDFFAANQVPVHLETSLVEVKEEAVVVRDKSGKTFEIPTDSTILSVGYKPAPMSSNKRVHVIGDARRVGNLRTVIWQAWDVAMKL